MKNNSSLSEQQKFMKMAIAEAKQARILDEVPIGAAIVMSVRWTGNWDRS